jgi:hypothetical protein
MVVLFVSRSLAPAIYNLVVMYRRSRSMFYESRNVPQIVLHALVHKVCGSFPLLVQSCLVHILEDLIPLALLSPPLPESR